MELSCRLQHFNDSHAVLTRTCSVGWRLIIICYIQRRYRWVWTQNRRSITTANVMKNSTLYCNFSRFRWRITQATASVIQDSPPTLQYSESTLYQTKRFSMPKIEITLGRCCWAGYGSISHFFKG